MSASTPVGKFPDLLQLAHYRRLLENVGMASPEQNYGGIIGSEGVVVWYDLDDARLAPSEYLEHSPPGPLTAMELYDLEFDHRLAVQVAAEIHLVDPAVRLHAQPIAVTDCDICRWRGWCFDRLAVTHDLSLIPKVGVARRRTYHQSGITDLDDLARMDWVTARLADDGVDLGDLLARAAGRSQLDLLQTVIPRRTKQLEHLSSHGIVAVGDTMLIDRPTLRVIEAGITDLASQIDAARARLGPSGAYRRRGVERIEVPRGDIEVDLDMENTLDGCYLWGALITDLRDPASTARYESFATWNLDLESGEVEAFMTFWAWLTEIRIAAESSGGTFRAYCYSKSAEEGQMKRIANRTGLQDEVSAVRWLRRLGGSPANCEEIRSSRGSGRWG